MANTNEGVDGIYWREAATMIFVAPCGATTSTIPTPQPLQDYNVLMMKRSEKSSFMPNVHVFPGGVVSPVDYDRRWDDLYRRVTGQSLADISSSLALSGVRPAMVTGPVTPNLREATSTDISFRITAIREAFEESGIAMLCNKSSKRRGRDIPGTVPFSCDEAGDETVPLSIWRERVNKDTGAFFDMCQTLQMVPNVWALYEWSNWLTPVMEKVTGPIKRLKRYDTLFYVCFLPAVVQASADEREIVESTHQWHSPAEFLQLKSTGKAQFSGPPPYELARMCNFSGLRQLEYFVQGREEHGLYRYLPVIFLLNDGALILLLPGDSRYPEKPDREGKGGAQVLDMALLEFEKDSHDRHRDVKEQGQTGRIEYNITPMCGHVMPFRNVMASL